MVLSLWERLSSRDETMMNLARLPFVAGKPLPRAVDVRLMALDLSIWYRPDQAPGTLKPHFLTTCCQEKTAKDLTILKGRLFRNADSHPGTN